jgi:major membrane immunogen (membrane-anchored lipoprotein)
MTELDAVADGEYTAVVDSIEDGLATVFFEQDETEVGHGVIDASELPEDSRHANAILSVTVADGKLTEIDYRSEQTATRQEAAQDRFDQLSSRPPTDDGE